MHDWIGVDSKDIGDMGKRKAMDKQCLYPDKRKE
jgi:hypothetical protein